MSGLFWLQSKKQTGSEMLNVNFEGAGLDHVLPEALSIRVFSSLIKP